MSLRIRPFVNGAVKSFEDLPFDDRIGSVRSVYDDNKDYICVARNLFTPHQWIEFDGESIVGSVTSGGTLDAPTFSPAAGSFTSTQNVTISAASGASILYTLNGSQPTIASTLYSGAITVSASQTIKAMAIKSGLTNSAVASALFTITAPGTVATPTFSPAAGSYGSSQTVTILCATSGATIYYTYNGTTPTTSSNLYSGAFSVATSATIKAIAVKATMTDSAVGSSAYVISAPFSPGDIANLTLALDMDTLSGAANEANITSLVDPINGSRSAVPTGTAPKKQTYRGLPVAHVLAGQILRSNVSLSSAYNSAITIIIVALADASGSNQTLVTATGGLTGPLGISESVSGVNRFGAWYSKTGSSAQYNIGQVVAYRYDGANYKQSRNKFHGSSNAVIETPGFSGFIDIGASGFSADFRFRQLYVFNRALTDAEIESMADYLCAKNAGFTANDNYLFVGDSQTGTTGGSGTVTYPEAVRTLLDSNSVQYNYIWTAAASGRTLLGNLAAVNDVVISTPNTGAHETIVLWAGTNAVTDGTTTGAQAVTQYANVIAAYTAKGANRFALLTCLTVATDNSFVIAARNTLNAYIRSLASSTVKIVDIAVDSRLTDPTNSTYFNADGLHLKDAGKLVVADLVYAVLNPW